MPDWVVKYWVEWAFGAVIAALGLAVKSLNKRVKKERLAREELARKATAETEALKSGMRSLLRRNILADCKQAMRDGCCDEDSRDTISQMYNAYSALGGNGTVSDIWETVKHLPLEKPING